MSETVVLALITALAAICTAAIGAYDRRTLYRMRTDDQLQVADQLLKHASGAV